MNSIICLTHLIELPHIKPMVIAVWCGNNKPNNCSAYLCEFVAELKHLLDNELSINNHRVMIHVRCFICDTPARAFLKEIVGHASYHACQKCMTLGVYDRTCRKVCFPRIPATVEERQEELRTDQSFRSRLQPRHHHGKSLLEELPIDMVKSFPIADALHLFDQGIMKR